jgi:hypothetical protein
MNKVTLTANQVIVEYPGQGSITFNRRALVIDAPQTLKVIGHGVDMLVRSATRLAMDAIAGDSRFSLNDY